MIPAQQTTTAEDFSLFQEEIPGAMFFLGMSNPAKGVEALNHLPGYDLDEDRKRGFTVTEQGVVVIPKAELPETFVK